MERRRNVSIRRIALRKRKRQPQVAKMKEKVKTSHQMKLRPPDSNRRRE